MGARFRMHPHDLRLGPASSEVKHLPHRRALYALSVAVMAATEAKAMVVFEAARADDGAVVVRQRP